MRILLLSDLHGVDYFTWQSFLKLDKCSFDIIITLGDIDIMFLQSLVENFSEKEIVGVHGNHDYNGDLEYFNINNIHGKSTSKDGVVISGLEGCLPYKKSLLLHADEDIEGTIKNIDPNTNIIISHNSPFGIHDKEGIVHRGYKALREFIEKNNPEFCIHGHQHQNIITEYGKTKIIGVYGGIVLDTETNEIRRVINLEELGGVLY